MKLNFVQELKWRGLIHNITPGTEDQFNKESTTAYVGFDSTSDSLHVGHLVPIILLIHLYNFGHQPIALIGEATGMIGDPAGKSRERNLLDEKILTINAIGIKKTLSRFLNFKSDKKKTPLLLNNYDWMKNFSFISFMREVGKKITVNYMLNKHTIKERIFKENCLGMSFTEFTYQLIQGYDFYYLYTNYNCKVQLGGSDQWGNITTGIEFIRKMYIQKTKVFAITSPLITKSDGSKFGKSEKENIWLDSTKTSVYLFYQFWMQISDEDAKKYIKIFTFLTKKEIQILIEEHEKKPYLFLLQKKLAYELTYFVHGEIALKKAIKASEILFGHSTKKILFEMDESTFLSIFNGVPMKEIYQNINFQIPVIDFLTNEIKFLSSKSEVIRALKENSLFINQQKVNSINFCINISHLISGKYILIERGKKNKFIVKVNYFK